MPESALLSVMEKQLPYLETLRRIAVGMGPQQGFLTSLKGFLTLLSARHGFLRPHLVIFDPETRTLRLCVADGVPRNGDVVYEPGIGVTGQVFVSGKPVIVERMEGHPVFLSKFFARSPEELARLAFVCVPVLAPQVGADTGQAEAQDVIGVLSVDTPCATRDVLEQQRTFLEVVASLIAAQATYLRDDRERQHRLASRGLGTIPEHAKRAVTGHGSGESSRRGRPGGMGGLDGMDGMDGLVAASLSLREALQQASCAAQGRAPVLISGEPGTGKARLAAFIHMASARHELPLLCFDAAPLETQSRDTQDRRSDSARSEDEAERLLFGYRKGAFPGATQTHKGLFELAHSSTLFLAHVDKLPLPLQAKLLRVLQEQALVRIGGGLPVGVDVRLICSSTKELPALVAAGRFLPELQERVSGFSLQLLPLRQRPEDVLPLAEHFLAAATKALGQPTKQLSAPVKDALLRHDWPGNAHELARAMHRVAEACTESTVRKTHLFALFQDTEKEPTLPFNDAVARFEQELLLAALQRTHGNMVQAARDLQVSYRIITYKVKKYGIKVRACTQTS